MQGSPPGRPLTAHARSLRVFTSRCAHGMAWTVAFSGSAEVKRLPVIFFDVERRRESTRFWACAWVRMIYAQARSLSGCACERIPRFAAPSGSPRAERSRDDEKQDYVSGRPGRLTLLRHFAVTWIGSGCIADSDGISVAASARPASRFRQKPRSVDGTWTYDDQVMVRRPHNRQAISSVCARRGGWCG